MQILLNGQEKTITPSCSIQDLISQLELQNRRIAVEVNLTLIPRSRFAEHLLVAGDKVEIVHAIGGG
ncbi:MAG: sulfur carrier protein ThiS [Thiotrichaceae bacterium]|nr:sulfur carrier protein ThiS [Thiotrichaceae bacterium]